MKKTIAKTDLRPHRVNVFCWEQFAGDAYEIYMASLRFCSSANTVPNCMSSNLDKGSNLRRYPNSHKKIVNAKNSELEDFELFNMPQEQRCDFAPGFDMHILLNSHCLRVFSVSIDAELVSDSGFEVYCHEIANLTKPTYGFRYINGGACAFVAMTEPEFSCDKFFRAGFIYRLHPWMLLNAYHLQRRLGSGTLETWIRADANRGVLSEYVEGAWQWSIPPEAIPQVEAALTPDGILFDKMKHCYPWFWTFAGRVERGDLPKEEVIRLMQEHVRRTGVVPTPPRRWQDDPHHPFRTDEAEVTRLLKEWGHPAAALPDFQLVPFTEEEGRRRMMGSLYRPRGGPASEG